MSSDGPDRYAVMGHPVTHSRSPFIHSAFAAATGQSLEYGKLDVTPECFEATVRHFFNTGGKGLSITVPHKEAAATIADTLTERAARAGAVNTMWRTDEGQLVGDNTDGIGLINDLTHNLAVVLKGARILILGAGGATRGIIGPLLEQQPASILLVNRTAERARALAAQFSPLGPIAARSADELGQDDFDLILNATSASLEGALPRTPERIFGPTTVAYDLAYAKDDTVFTRFARSHGAQAAYMGLGMLVEQAAEAFAIWRGVRPMTTDVLKALTSAS
jgi:shikimate dehydrogenase